MDSLEKVHQMTPQWAARTNVVHEFTNWHESSPGGTYVELKPHERIQYTDKFDDPNCQVR